MYFIINQFSFILVAVFLLLFATIISRQILDFKIALVFILIVTISLIFAQIFLKTKTSEILNVEDLNNSLESHKFSLIQIYSDFWVACLSSKPIVDRLESELPKDINFIRLDINSEPGKYIRNNYQINTVPSYLILNKEKEKIWRQNLNVPSIELVNKITKNNSWIKII